MADRTAVGFWIRIFLPDGTPEGVRVVEKSNWTGVGIVCPRALYPTAKSRPEFDRTGVYILTGPSTEADLPMAYVGQADPVKRRVDSHHRDKDFWTHVTFFTSKDRNLNSAYAEYLESNLIRLAAEAKRCVLDNGNRPEAPSLSEADTAEVRGFLDEMLLCLPVMGLTLFERPAAATSPKSLLYLGGKGVTAAGHESAQGFVVLKGSQVVEKEVPSIHEYLVDLRRSLIDRGIVAQVAGVLVFTQDYMFDSPSTAAGVVYGRSANGRTEWRNKQGKSLKQIQSER